MFYSIFRNLAAHMKKISPEEVVAYYNSTFDNYNAVWDQKTSMALHYGYSDEKTHGLRNSLSRMNEEVFKFAGIQPGMRVLDAGCGVGGSTIFLANQGCEAVGIGLVPKQIEQAKKNANLAKNPEFLVANFFNTPFEVASFDAIWGIESVVHTMNKKAFFEEAFRILKPGGVVVVAEYIRQVEINSPDYLPLEEWMHGWECEGMASMEEYRNAATAAGLTLIEARDVTENIFHTARYMWRWSFLRHFTYLYRLYNPKASKYAKYHWKTAVLQYKTLKKGHWTYNFLLFEKKA